MCRVRAANRPAANILRSNYTHISPVKIFCPYCQHCETDPFEVLEVNKLYPSFACDKCCLRFSLLIKECANCDAEQVHVWETVPSPAEVERLLCEACGKG